MTDATSAKGSAHRYLVYVNGPNRKSVGHIENCGSVKIWGGATTAAGVWLGPFDTRREAENAGRLSGKPFHWCGHCRGRQRPALTNAA